MSYSKLVLNKLEELLLEDYAANRKRPRWLSDYSVCGAGKTSNQFGPPAENHFMEVLQSLELLKNRFLRH